MLERTNCWYLCVLKYEESQLPQLPQQERRGAITGMCTHTHTTQSKTHTITTIHTHTHTHKHTHTHTHLHRVVKRIPGDYKCFSNHHLVKLKHCWLFTCTSNKRDRKSVV